MKSHIQIISTPTADTTGTTVLLHFDDKRYLFGSLGEGTQRSLNQLGTRLMKTQDVFVTGRSEWQNTGGLVGMMLTLSDVLAAHNLERTERGLDVTPKVLSLFGPPNLTHTIATCRRFVFRKGMPINVVDIEDGNFNRDGNGDPIPLFVDANIKVWAMSITPNSAEGPAQPPAAAKPMEHSFNPADDPRATVDPSQNTLADSACRYSQITRSVVHDMFNSSWRLDALAERPLCEVKLPAIIFRRNTVTRAIERYTGPAPDPADPHKKVLVREPWPAVKVTALPPTEPAPQSISYIIRNQAQRGKFLVEKAVQHAVPKGALWSKLQAGMSVENTRGEMITSNMVVGPSRRGKGVAIVDLPTPAYVEPLIRRDEWTCQEIINGVEAFLWILGPGVAAHPGLQEFIDQRAQLKHIISSVDVLPNRISFDSASAATLRLGMIDKKRYTAPYHDNIQVPQRRFVAYPSRIGRLPDHCMPAERGLVIQLEPKFDVQRKDIIPPFDPAKAVTGIPVHITALAKSLAEGIEHSSEQLARWSLRIPMPNAEIITLGTGSALPSKYRNVSATLVLVPGYGSYLLDAGENTLGQLQRVFRPLELSEVLKDLRVIWISHMHADHILGIVTVIKAWYEVVHACQSTVETAHEALDTIKKNPVIAAEMKRLAIIADLNMVNWLAEYAAVEDFGYSRIWPLAITTNTHSDQDDSRDRPALLRLRAPPSFIPSDIPPTVEVPGDLYTPLLGLQDVQAVYVDHCHGARAVSLTWPADTRPRPDEPEGTDNHSFKVSYSGDCRPSAEFARIGRHSAVLVHEATFEDGLEAEAVAKKHSTTSEALATGVRMGAAATLLTHFSQRYQKLPIVEHRKCDSHSDSVHGNASMDMEDTTNAGEVPYAKAEAVEVTDSAQAPALVKTKALPAFTTRKGVASDMVIGIASDYMRVKVGEFAELERYMPVMQALLAEERVLDDNNEGKEASKYKLEMTTEDP